MEARNQANYQAAVTLSGLYTADQSTQSHGPSPFMGPLDNKTLQILSGHLMYVVRSGVMFGDDPRLRLRSVLNGDFPGFSKEEALDRIEVYGFNGGPEAHSKSPNVTINTGGTMETINTGHEYIKINDIVYYDIPKPADPFYNAKAQVLSLRPYTKQNLQRRIMQLSSSLLEGPTGLEGPDNVAVLMKLAAFAGIMAVVKSGNVLIDHADIKKNVTENEKNFDGFQEAILNVLELPTAYPSATPPSEDWKNFASKLSSYLSGKGEMFEEGMRGFSKETKLLSEIQRDFPENVLAARRHDKTRRRHTVGRALTEAAPGHNFVLLIDIQGRE